MELLHSIMLPEEKVCEIASKMLGSNLVTKQTTAAGMPCSCCKIIISN